MTQMTLENKPIKLNLVFTKSSENLNMHCLEFCDDCQEVTVHVDGRCIDCHILEMEL